MVRWNWCHKQCFRCDGYLVQYDGNRCTYRQRLNQSNSSVARGHPICHVELHRRRQWVLHQLGMVEPWREWDRMALADMECYDVYSFLLQLSLEEDRCFCYREYYRPSCQRRLWWLGEYVYERNPSE